MERINPNRVQFFEGKSKICCFAKCILGGTPLGIVYSLLILNFPMALLIILGVIKFDFE
jgi:hypothetical protein